MVLPRDADTEKDDDDERLLFNWINRNKEGNAFRGGTDFQEILTVIL